MFDINNNLFGYIEKSSEMNDTIIQRYKNSLIFIGDEKQIYVPTTNSYVGVGMSTINNIKNSIPSIDKIYIKDIANNSLANTYTTYYFPVINGTTPNAYYYTYVALNVGVNPVSGKFIGGLQGTADYSTVSDLTYKTTTKSTNNNSSYYISFVNNINDESYTYVNNKLLYNPYEETLKSTYFVGDLKGHAETADYATYSTYTSYTTYALFNSYQSVHSINNNSKYCITFSKNLAYSLSYIDGEFYYNPALNSAYAGHFFGVFHGNVDNADTVDGFHANDLFTYFRNGDNNCAYIEIGDVEKYLQLNSYTLGGKTKEELFTNFSTEANQTTSITIGDTTKKLKIDAYKILVTEKSNNTTYPILFTNSNNLNNSNFAYTNTCISINPYYKSFAQGNNVSANAPCAHAEGTNTIAGDYAHAEGSSTKASGDTSHAEGYLSEAQGQFSHAEGQNVRAKNICSHAEGVNTEAGPYAHAEGSSTKASGDTSHAEGYLSEAQGQFSHAEGSTNIASGWCSHVGGNGSTSSGDQSFAHGNNTIASGWASFAINANTTASGLCSFVCGQDTQALHNYEAAFGKFNKSNSNTIFSVGIGTDNDHRANAFEVTVNGLIKGYAGFYHCGIQSNNYVLTGAGGYKKWAEGYEVSTIVARNASGQIYCSHLNTTSNNMDSTAFTKVFVSDDNWIRYVTKAKFVEALREEDTVSFDKSLIVTEAWMDTGIVVNTTNFPKGSGTYAIQISHANLTTPGTNGYASLYSGIISIYTDGTNSTTDSEEIILHRAGHAWVNRIYIRTMPVAATGNCKIQIAASKTWTAASNVTFKFRKLI